MGDGRCLAQQDCHPRLSRLCTYAGSEQARKAEKGAQRSVQRASAGARRSLSSRGAKLVSNSCVPLSGTADTSNLVQDLGEPCVKP